MLAGIFPVLPEPTAMHIAAATLRAYSLPLRSPWPGAARQTGTNRQGWLVSVETDEGHYGFGECAPLPAHGSEPAETALRTLQEACSRLPGMPLAEALSRPDGLLPEEAILPSMPSLTASPAAHAALEMALLDLAAQAAGQPLWQYLSGSPSARPDNGRPYRRVKTNALAGDLASVSVSDLLDLVTKGFKVIKLKLGTAGARDELNAIRTLAAALPPSIRFRLDANRAWDLSTATHVCEALADLPIDMLEEPLAGPCPGMLSTLGSLQRNLPYPLALDESWQEVVSHGGQEKFFLAPPVHRLVLKLAPHGGMLAALATARRAQSAGIECVITTGIDSACATHAAVHLAAAIDNGMVHGLATSCWLSTDTGSPPAVMDGQITLSDTPGLGFRPAVEFHTGR